MKQLHGSKSKLFSPAAFALAVGLACWSSAALATVKPRPLADMPVGIVSDPGGVRVNTKTDKQGNYKFTGLPAGKYRVKIPGQPDQFFTVGPDGTLRGKIPIQAIPHEEITY